MFKMVVPRSKNHFAAMLTKFGKSFFRTVPGIYGSVGSRSFATSKSTWSNGKWAMNSGVSEVAKNWHAVDGGSWFLTSSP